jgi:hypothetical protein
MQEHPHFALARDSYTRDNFTSATMGGPRLNKILAREYGAAQNIAEVTRTYTSFPGILALAALVWSSTCDAQSAPAAAFEATPPAIDTSHCLAIAAGGPPTSPISALCEFALTYRRELPDFVCDQTTTTTGPKSTTVLKAEVTFEKGHESYSNVTINGRPPEANTSASASTVKFISAGELGSDLVDLFRPPIVAEFQFKKEEKFRKIPSSVYQFHIAAEKNTFWALRDSRGVTLHPEYEGELWLERQNGRLLRLELRPAHLPENFRIASADITIDYSDTPIGNLGTFLLPSTSETKLCDHKTGLMGCTKNVLVFHDCRKFAAKARILTDDPQP